MNLGSAYTSTFKQRLDAAPTAKLKKEAPLMEFSKLDSMAAGVGATDEESFVVEYRARDYEMERYLAARELDVDLSLYMDEKGNVNYDKLKEDTNAEGLYTDKEVMSLRKEELDRRFEYRQQAAEANPMSYMSGAMLGGVGTDPVMASTVVLGAPAALLARASTTIGKVATLAATEAVIGGATEAALQYGVVLPYKQELGREYGRGDVFEAIAMSAAFGFGLGGVAGGVGGIAGYLKRNESVLDDEVLELVPEITSNPQRLDYPEFKREALTVIRMDADTLRAVSQQKGRIGELATSLIKARAKVEKQVSAGKLEPNKVPPVLRSRPLSEKAAKMAEEQGQLRVDPEYRERLESRSEAIESDIAAIKQEIRVAKWRGEETPETKAKLEEKITGKLAEKNGVDQKIQEAKEAEAALNSPEAREVEVEWATAVAQKAEDVRVKRLKEADERYIQRMYEDDLIRTDMDWLRRMQSEMEELYIGKPDAAPAKTPRELREIAQAEVEVPDNVKQQGVIAKAEASNNPYVKDILLDTQRIDGNIQRLKNAESCL